ncbi:hypothetical protein IAU60_001342 [Kwoniella sp. DSM 27419]
MAAGRSNLITAGSSLRQLARMSSRLTPASLRLRRGYASSDAPNDAATGSAGSPSGSSLGAASKTAVRHADPPGKPTLLNRYSSRLSALSARTGVPLPSLGLSFMVLHEVTAVVPVVAFYWIFAYLGTGASLVAWIMDVAQEQREREREAEGDQVSHEGAPGSPAEMGAAVKGTTNRADWDWRIWVKDWYEEGEKRVGRVGRRYGILGYDKRPAGSTEAEAQAPAAEGQGALAPVDAGAITANAGGSGAASKVADAIAAYVLVKALLPVRIAVSIGAAPALARYTLVPLQRVIQRFRSPR